jgi:hypothetical protein
MHPCQTFVELWVFFESCKCIELCSWATTIAQEALSMPKLYEKTTTTTIHMPKASRKVGDSYNLKIVRLSNWRCNFQMLLGFMAKQSRLNDPIYRRLVWFHRACTGSIHKVTARVPSKINNDDEESITTITTAINFQMLPMPVKMMIVVGSLVQKMISQLFFMVFHFEFIRHDVCSTYST